MLKRFGILLSAFVLFGCATQIHSNSGVYTDLTAQRYDLNSSQFFKVGILLPLSGSNAKYGKGLQNAAMLALDDAKNPHLVLKFYDTKGTPEGARTAMQNALNNKPNLILGPLMSTSVQAVSAEALSDNVPMIAFSTAEEVLEPGVYTLGLLIEEQVNRIVKYAAERGRQKFALLLPNNNTGIAVARAAVKAVHNNGKELAVIAFYPPETSDFSETLKDITNYNVRNGRLKAVKEKLETALKLNPENEIIKANLKKLETTDTIGDIDFDAVLLPESGIKLKSAVSMFGYYDVYAPKVKFLGLSTWENTLLNKESALRGAWYPALSHYQGQYFANKYASFYGEKPAGLYSLAYDGVALASTLSTAEDMADLHNKITNPDGYMGISGIFRFFANGKNEHSLDIYEITNNGDIIVNAAKKKFAPAEENIYANSIAVDEFFKAPLIFGKEKSEAYYAIYGKNFDEAEQYSRNLTDEEEKALLEAELKKLKIVMP